MAYTTLNSADLQAGKPFKEDIPQQIKTNEDDLNSRLNSIESGANKVIVLDSIVANSSQYASSSTFTGLIYWKAPSAFTLTTAIVTVLSAGASGTTEVDLLKSSTIGGTFTTVFSTRPSVLFSAGDNTESTNAIFSTTSVAQGDWLRVDITSFQTVQKKFAITIYGEVS